MIRHRRGSEIFLITQHDHAVLSGRFAEQFGNERFAEPSPRRSVINGVSLHDAGWPLHDDRPTVNERGEPLNVLEVSMPVAVRVWGESVKRAAARDLYGGLLVSLHVMNLSSLAHRNDAQPHERARDQSDLFELNKFQHRQVEVQEQLRQQVGLRTDLPLRLGVAEPGTSPEEDLLRFNFGLLRAVDSFSLDGCASDDLFPEIAGIHPRPGDPPVALKIGHPATLTLTVDPWPFSVSKVAHEVAARRVPGGRYESDAELQARYAEAPVEMLTVRLLPAR